MPSPLHETLLELFRARPEPTAQLLAEPLRVAVPVHARARLSAAEVVDRVRCASVGYVEANR